MDFTQVQIKEILGKVASQEDGFNILLKMSLEAMMKAERTEFNSANSTLSNGFRTRKAFGDKQMIELQIPRTRTGEFYPVILGILKNQEKEAHSLSFSLYRNGLTTAQVGEIFEEIYGKHYSTSQVSRMFDSARDEVNEWQKRPLDSYYPIVYIDATFISTRRVDNVSKEAYYTLLAVKSDETREVLGVYNFPTEGASMWDEIFEDLKARGMKEVSLFVSDSLTGIETPIFKNFKTAELQLCTVHLERNILKQVKPIHKAMIVEDFKEVFVTDDKNDTKEAGKKRFVAFLEIWGEKYEAFKKMAKSDRLDYYLTFLGYDYRIRKMIHSTNWIERLNRDFKRTTRMRGALPSPEATLLLLGGVAMTRKAYLRKVPNIKNEKTKFRWDD